MFDVKPAMGVDGNYFGTRPHYYEPIPSFRLIAKAPFRYDRGRNGHGRNYTEEALRDLEQLILSERPETVAGLIFDPLALASGVYPPPPDYMQGLRALLDRYGILLILDEVITGFARTGRMFAADHWGIVPDVMTVSKGLSSGYMPIGAAGLILFSDPADDGYLKGPVYPDGPWRPADSIQRGSIMYLFNYAGDPLTPGWAATENAHRLDP